MQSAKASYSDLPDPAHYNKLNEVLTTQYSREALTAYINGYSGTGQYKSAIADADLDVMLKDVQQRWIPGAKMSALTSAFANTSNYFTTDQASQLIQLVSDEDNRLQLAKASYRNLTDPAHYTKLNELLTTQYSRDALTA